MCGKIGGITLPKIATALARRLKITLQTRERLTKQGMSNR